MCVPMYFVTKRFSRIYCFSRCRTLAWACFSGIDFSGSFPCNTTPLLLHWYAPLSLYCRCLSCDAAHRTIWIIMADRISPQHLSTESDFSTIIQTASIPVRLHLIPKAAKQTSQETSYMYNPSGIQFSVLAVSPRVIHEPSPSQRKYFLKI